MIFAKSETKDKHFRVTEMHVKQLEAEKHMKTEHLLFQQSFAELKGEQATFQQI